MIETATARPKQLNPGWPFRFPSTAGCHGRVQKGSLWFGNEWHTSGFFL